MSIPALTLTANAIAKASELITGENDPNLKLRVSIIGGGCSGFQYCFGFESQQEDDDIIITAGPVQVVVDQISIAYLQGASIDYSKDLQGARFVVNNPNAKTTCGCGSSFSID